MTVISRKPLAPPEALPSAQLVSETVTACRNALAADALCLPGAETPESCFALANGFPFHKRTLATLREQRAHLMRMHAIDAPAAEARIFRHIVLQAFLHAAPRLGHAICVDAALRQPCYILSRVAADPASIPPGAFTDEPCAELARLVTLRRFAVGQLSFDIMPIPRAWFLKIHPLALPAFARHAWRLRGNVASPHICHWRANRFFISERENERALLHIAAWLRACSEIRGIVSSSWLYDPDIARHSPHLAWLDAMFLRGGARFFDAGPAIDGAGFALGNPARRDAVERGALRPRETILLWHRDQVLAWADAIEAGARPQAQAGAGLPARRRLRSRARGLYDARRLLYFRPRQYILAVFGPALAAALAAGLASGRPALGLAAAALLVPLAWLGQYFLLQ